MTSRARLRADWLVYTQLGYDFRFRNLVRMMLIARRVAAFCYSFGLLPVWEALEIDPPKNVFARSSSNSSTHIVITVSDNLRLLSNPPVLPSTIWGNLIPQRLRKKLRPYRDALWTPHSGSPNGSNESKMNPIAHQGTIWWRSKVFHLTYCIWNPNIRNYTSNFAKFTLPPRTLLLKIWSKYEFLFRRKSNFSRRCCKNLYRSKINSDVYY